jgi:hypothetical protein
MIPKIIIQLLIENLVEWQTFLPKKNHLKILLDQTSNNLTTTLKLDINMV